MARAPTVTDSPTVPRQGSAARPLDTRVPGERGAACGVSVERRERGLLRGILRGLRGVERALCSAPHAAHTVTVACRVACVSRGRIVRFTMRANYGRLAFVACNVSKVIEKTESKESTRID